MLIVKNLPLPANLITLGGFSIQLVSPASGEFSFDVCELENHHPGFPFN